MGEKSETDTSQRGVNLTQRNSAKLSLHFMSHVTNDTQSYKILMILVDNI